MPVLAAFVFLLLSPPPSSLDVYAGIYSLVPAESADMKKVVDDAAAGLNFFIRSIARSRLRKTQVAFPAITISRTPGEFRISHKDGTDIAHRTIEDPVQAVSPDGAKIVVRLVAGPPMAQSYESGEGMRTNRYTLSPDRSKLMMDVRITSPRLPKPIEYQLVYRRN